MPPVASQMPVVFANGTCWNEITGSCRGCGQSFAESAFRGVVSRPLPSVAVIEAVGLCPHCRLITRFDYRLHSDMRMTGMRNGRWSEWRTRRTLLGAIRRGIRKLFQGISA